MDAFKITASPLLCGIARLCVSDATKVEENKRNQNIFYFFSRNIPIEMAECTKMLTFVEQNTLEINP